MTRRTGFLVLGILLAGIVLVDLLIHVATSRSESAAPSPPEPGAPPLSARLHEIAFDQQYDLFCSFQQEEPTTFRNCTILGFTGREEAARSRRGFSSFGSSSYQAGEYFDDWLVLKLADGRLAYIPPNAVRYIEQAAPEE